MPEAPIPPNGRPSMRTCSNVSLTDTPPEMVLLRISSRCFASCLERQRPRAAVDIFDGFLDPAVGLHREYRTEDLVPHDREVLGWLDDERRRELARLGPKLLARGIELDDLRALLLGFEEVIRQALIMGLVDDR